MLVVFTALIGLASLLPIVGEFAALLVWLAAYKHGFEILLATANGQRDVPAVSFDLEKGVIWRYVVLQFAALMIPMSAGHLIGPETSLALGIAIGIVLPAATIGLALTGHLSDALSPWKLIPLVGRIGWPYLALVGLVLVIDESAWTAQAYLEEWMPTLAAGAVGSVFALWGVFATFHLMGYLVWQYHEELGFEPQARNSLVSVQARQDGELLARVEALLADGEVDAAITLLRVEIRERVVAIPVHELYRRAIKLKGDPSLVLEHASVYARFLVAENDLRRALTVIRDAATLDPSFAPFEIGDGERLATAAARAGQTDLALLLYRGLIARAPKHPRFPQWALEASDIAVRRGEPATEPAAWLEQAAALATQPEVIRRIEAQRRAMGGVP